MKLDRFLAQVQALVELHNLQRKELLEAKSALREAQIGVECKLEKIELASIQQPEASRK
jgi:hypothetical protein